jgi:hypothetical protein
MAATTTHAKEATMQSPKPLRPALAAVLAVLALTLVAAAARAHDDEPRPSKQRTSERLVVRGDATVTDDCDPNGCELRLEDGQFRGTPVGTGPYTGDIKLKLADQFPNGEGGGCAPIQGRIELGSGTPNRLLLALWGDSCQDGAGDPTATSFTGLAQFVVVDGTGSYSKASGRGTAAFLEDAADHDRMTLIGRLTR